MASQGHEIILGFRDHDNQLLLGDNNKTPRHTITPPRQISGFGPLATLINSFYFLLFVCRIGRFIRQWQPDVVQLNRSNLNWHWILPLCYGRNIKFIQDCRQVETPSYSSNPLKAVKQRIRFASHVFFIKRIYARATYLHWRGAQRELGKGWQRYADVVPLGVGNEFLTFPSRQGFASSTSFLYIGSITRYRKLELLIDAAAELKKNLGGEFKLVFAGPDNSQGFYQNRVKQLELDDQVKFLGAVPYTEIPELLHRFQVAIAYVPTEPKDWTYQPTLKVLEYLALGIPVLASKVAPNEEITDQFHNGLVVENNVESWAQGMQQFAEDKAFAEQCEQRAVANRTGNSWQQTASQYIALYQRLKHSDGR